MLTVIRWVMFALYSCILSLQVWWFRCFVWWSSWTVLLNMTTEKNTLSSSWCEKTCFSASWWRRHSWPWAIPTALLPRLKVITQTPPPLQASCVPWNSSLKKVWRRNVKLASFLGSEHQKIFLAALFSCYFGKHLISTSRTTQIDLHFKEFIILSFSLSQQRGISRPVVRGLTPTLPDSTF